MRNYLFATFLLASSFAPSAAPAQDDDLVTYKALSPDLALDLAKAALESCRQEGFQVAVAVVDRFGIVQVLLRDRFAGPHTPDSARRKAWTAVSFRADTSNLLDLAAPGSPQAAVRDIGDALMLGGGVLVEAAGSIVGAIGISGSPGGPQDDACARAGIEAIRERLEF